MCDLDKRGTASLDAFLGAFAQFVARGSQRASGEAVEVNEAMEFWGLR